MRYEEHRSGTPISLLLIPSIFLEAATSSSTQQCNHTGQPTIQVKESPSTNQQSPQGSPVSPTRLPRPSVITEQKTSVVVNCNSTHISNNALINDQEEAHKETGTAEQLRQLRKPAKGSINIH